MATFPPEVAHTVPAHLAAFLAHAVGGRREGAHARVTPELEKAAATTDVFSRLLAQGYALVDMREQALRWLAVAVDRGFINYPFLTRHDPFFLDIRRDDSFRRLMKTVRVRWESFEE